MKTEAAENQQLPFKCCRDEATRTPDPYVPNVVRYQLRYIPNGRKWCSPLLQNRLQRYGKFLNYVQFYIKKFVFTAKNKYLCKRN